jgi:outer membrane protein assembly factor BamB
MVRLISVKAACVVWFLSSCAQAENWPQFRGPQGDGVVQSNSPSQWTSDEHVAWKVKIDGVGWSQPIVWGDKVFVTTGVADDRKRPRPGDWSPGEGGILTALFGSYKKPPSIECRLQVLCLDAATGKALWEHTAYTGRPKIPIHPSNSYATETPATDGQRLIASFGSMGVYCYDYSGQLLWSKDSGSYPTQMDWGTASSPILNGELAYLQCDNDKDSFLVALDTKTGDEVWRAARDELSNWSTPILWKHEERTELVVGGGTKMRSYHPASGKLLWEMDASGRCSPSPVVSGGLLYVGSADRLTGQRGIVAAIKPGASGDISVTDEKPTNEYVVWSAKISGHRVASPLVAADCLYLLEQQAGIVRCLDAKTGKEHYRKRLPGATGLTASPWVAGDKVFCLDQSGQTFVLAAGPEYNVLATNKLPDEMYWSSPAIAGESLFIRGIDHLYCIR